ncbi:MAG TPA: response regulator transcription factor [Candidatus Binatia bacterium]|jgi:DNA-binding NarL/FixJ family response regulator|nr:response regulator transcription factor [Candidatus Binatia bacterium]
MALPIRVIIADDHALFRQGLRSMLRLQPDVTITADVDRIADLPGALATTPCDVVLLDLQMDRNTLPDIEALGRRVRVVVVTASEQPGDALAALRAGARAVVWKRFAIETLMEAVRAVMEGHVWMPPALQAELTTQMLKPSNEALSAREREIVRLVAMGLRNAEIGRRLAITEATVKTHLNNVFQKLTIRDRVELTRYAIRVGLIGVNETPEQ